MKPKQKNKGGRPRNKRTDAIAEEFGVTKRQAENLDKGGASVEDIKAARLRKLKLEAERLEIAIDKEKAELIPRVKVEEEGVAIGTAIKAQLKAWIGALPGRLEGLTAGQMVPILEEEVTRVLRVLSKKCLESP